VNQLGPVRSTYRWQGSLEQASETMLLIKTTRDRYLDLQAQVIRLHPYAVPEILAIPVQTGFSDYLTWVTAETRADTDQNG
jgi:periplasmic divalent cation tolerance protein